MDALLERFQIMCLACQESYDEHGGEDGRLLELTNKLIRLLNAESPNFYRVLAVMALVVVSVEDCEEYKTIHAGPVQ
jgi:hypothetical protein